MGTDVVSRLTVAPSAPAAGFGTLYPLGASDAALEWYFKRPNGDVLTLAHLEGAQTFTGALTLTAASPQLTLGVLNTTSGGIKFFGSTSGNVTLAPNVAAGASVTVTLPATSVTLNAAGDLTGNTLAAGVTASSLTSVGASLSIGSTLPSTGVIRIPNNQFIFSRAGASDRQLIGHNSSDQLVIGGADSGVLTIYNSGTGGGHYFQVNSITVYTIGASGGLIGGAPTGGDKGSGTANFAADIYKNNQAYTNPDYVLEHWATGKIVKYADKEGAASYAGLQSLASIEQFAKQNWHLPRFGQQAGHGLFGGSDALLASVEESYLHLFDHEKRLRTLEARLK